MAMYPKVMWFEGLGPFFFGWGSSEHFNEHSSSRKPVDFLINRRSVIFIKTVFPVVIHR